MRQKKHSTYEEQCITLRKEGNSRLLSSKRIIRYCSLVRAGLYVSFVVHIQPDTHYLLKWKKQQPYENSAGFLRIFFHSVPAEFPMNSNSNSKNIVLFSVLKHFFSASGADCIQNKQT